MKIVSFDIESTDLKAMTGRVLCASFMPIVDVYNEGDLRRKFKPYTLRSDDKKYKEKNELIDDSLLTLDIANELSKYNMVVTWNGKMFDIPFINARLAKFGLPPANIQFHLDLMYYAGGVSMRIGSRKLVNVQKFLGLESEKTEISWDDWQRAASGDKKAMDEVVTHCEADVVVLADAYKKMLPLVSKLHR